MKKNSYKILCIDCCENMGICIHCDIRAKLRGRCDKCKISFNYE